MNTGKRRVLRGRRKSRPHLRELYDAATRTSQPPGEKARGVPGTLLAPPFAETLPDGAARASPLRAQASDAPDTPRVALFGSSTVSGYTDNLKPLPIRRFGSQGSCRDIPTTLAASGHLCSHPERLLDERLRGRSLPATPEPLERLPGARKRLFVKTAGEVATRISGDRWFPRAWRWRTCAT
jgi:hypothetical protein